MKVYEQGRGPGMTLWGEPDPGSREESRWGLGGNLGDMGTANGMS